MSSEQTLLLKKKKATDPLTDPFEDPPTTPFDPHSLDRLPKSNPKESPSRNHKSPREKLTHKFTFERKTEESDEIAARIDISKHKPHNPQNIAKTGPNTGNNKRESNNRPRGRATPLKTLRSFQLYVFAVSSLIGLSSLTNSNFLFVYKYNLDIDPARAQFFVSLAALPICLRPFYGVFLDYMNFKGHSKHTVFLYCCLLELCATFGGWLADPQTLYGNFALNILLSFFLYSKLVVVDALLVVLIRKFNRRLGSEAAR